MQNTKKTQTSILNFSCLILHKEAKYILWREDSVFNNQLLKNWRSACRKMKLFCTKIRSKQSKDLNLKLKTIILLKEKTGSSLQRSRYKKGHSKLDPICPGIQVNKRQLEPYKTKMLLFSSGSCNLMKKHVRWQRFFDS